MSLVFLILGVILFLYALVYKPEFIAILLFTFIIADINLDIKGIPLNARAFITIVLFIRILFDKSSAIKYPRFLNSAGAKLFLVFMLYMVFVSWGQDTLTFDLLKQILSTVLSAFCAYHFFFIHGNANTLKISLLISGIICFVDLAYTYVAFGSFPVQRLYFLFTGVPAQEIAESDFFMSDFNHNFFGQVCGMCFAFVFSDLINNRPRSKFILLLLPLMFLGILMSTSRSALLATIIISAAIIINGMRDKEQRKQVYKIGSFAIGIIVLGILFFSTLGTYFQLNNKFADEVIFRLTDEPVAVIRKALGQNYNAQNLGSLNWREEASSDAYAAYTKLNAKEQFTGIGQGGFIERDLGNGLNPHNGILLILIETGIIGLVLYFSLIGGTMIQSMRQKNISPSFAVLGYILIYGIGQNAELTSTTTFLFVFTLIAEIQRNKNYFVVSDDLQA